MRTIAISGSGSGIGAALRRRLEAEGTRVLGVDLAGAEIKADLATTEGRARACAEVIAAAGGCLDGAVACAGLGPHLTDAAAITSVNYFGAVAFLAGLRESLARGSAPAALAVSSNSITISPGADGPLAAACLAGDETAARQQASDGITAYAGSKLALARWVRRCAVGPGWAGAGIRLNAIAPGLTQTPMIEAGLAAGGIGAAIRALPVPLGGAGRPEQIAAAMAFLLGPDAAFCCGSVVFVDGGSDALLNPGHP